MGFPGNDAFRLAALTTEVKPPLEVLQGLRAR
jgi:hypothetical protein